VGTTETLNRQALSVARKNKKNIENLLPRVRGVKTSLFTR
jgi:hypothetical protein